MAAVRLFKRPSASLCEEVNMKTSGFVFAVILLGLGAAALLRAAPQAAPAKLPEELLKAKVDAAHRTYEVVWKNNKEALIPFVELAYRWSRRWLEAEAELRGRKADRPALCQAHPDRMRTLERITQ